MHERDAPAIVADRLSKVYRVQKKPPGLLGSARSLVRRTYTDVRAVDEVSFAIGRGELVGFLGPNGAGKTTTLKMLSGLLEPSGGMCRVLGHEPFRRERAFQRRFALVLGQKNQLWWDLPAIESFLLNKEIYGLDERAFRATLDELVELLELGALLDVQVRKLSLGERMKCELVGALLHRPEVLFLDEPTIGLDVVAQATIRGFLQAYNERWGSTIVLTSHYMDDVKALCERVIVIDHGRLIFDGGLRELVQRYADDKVLTVELERVVPREELAEIGEVLAWDGRTATVRVPREEVSARAAGLLARFPVLDLAIAEPDVDEVIRALFSGRLGGTVGDADRTNETNGMGEAAAG
jgi:ABC-2 type transport system ATP-binding protein